MHQPTKPNHSEAVGAAVMPVSPNQAKPTPQEIVSRYAEFAMSYKNILNEPNKTIEYKGGQFDSDGYLRFFVANFAAKLYIFNLQIIKANKGFSVYSGIEYLFDKNDPLGSVSLNYHPDSGLKITLFAKNKSVDLPFFVGANIWDEKPFVDYFCNFGDTTFGDFFANSFIVCMDKDKKGVFFRNPVREFFHQLFIDFLTE
jgi:hypothetical protein